MTDPKDDPIRRFREEVRQRVSAYPADHEWRSLSLRWLESAFLKRYMYNFSWLGRPIIQLPADVVALQETIWRTRPDLIVETGIAHGGSLVFSASMLALLDVCDALEAGQSLDPRASSRRVLGVDIDIRPHNRAAIEAHPLSGMIEMIEGSSLEPTVVAAVRERASRHRRVLVCLDSHHTHQHVLGELEAYAPLVSSGSYCVVFDTIIESLPEETFPDRPWKPGNSPETAIREFLRLLASPGRLAADGEPLHLELDREADDKLVLSATPGGCLRRVSSPAGGRQSAT